MYDRTTVRPTVQGATFSMRGQLYHGHYLIISPLHGHGEVANENPLILPRTLSIVGALVLLKRRAGKKMRAPLLGLPKSKHYFCTQTKSFSWYGSCNNLLYGNVLTHNEGIEIVV